MRSNDEANEDVSGAPQESGEPLVSQATPGLTNQLPEVTVQQQPAAEPQPAVTQGMTPVEPEPPVMGNSPEPLASTPQGASHACVECSSVLSSAPSLRVQMSRKHPVVKSQENEENT